MMGILGLVRVTNLGTVNHVAHVVLVLYLDGTRTIGCLPHPSIILCRVHLLIMCAYQAEQLRSESPFPLVHEGHHHLLLRDVVVAVNRGMCVFYVFCFRLSYHTRTIGKR